MADSFTPSLNLRKPEVGHAGDTWGGTAGLNSDLDIIDAIFLATGLGTAVGLHVGPAQVLNVEGGITLKDPTDTTKVAVLDRSLITTATTRIYQFPDEDGVLATKPFLTKMVPTGTVWSGYYGNTPPTGFVFLDGRTIGDPTSGATNRANADTQALFTLFWNFGSTVLPSRGASAAADWAAHKTITLPNHAGRVMAGRDNLSGAAANILPGLTAAGQRTGEATHLLTATEIPLHQHTVLGGQNVGAFGNTGRAAYADGINAGTMNTSNGADMGVGGQVHNNVQPTIAVDVVIAL